MDQDPAGKAAVRVASAGGDVTGPAPCAKSGETSSVTLPREQVWSKPLADGARAVGLFNLGETPAAVTADFATLGLTGGQRVRDLWRQKDLGRATGQFTAIVPSHGVVLVKVTPDR